MKTIEPPKNLSPRLHRDGTVSYWSFGEGRWIDHTYYVPDKELDRLDPWRRQRVEQHLRRGEHRPTESAPVPWEGAGKPMSDVAAGD